MVRLYDLKVGDAEQFRRVLHQGGFTGEMALRVIREPELVARLVAVFYEEGTAEVPANLFIPPADQLAQVRKWNAKRGWGFTEADFEALGDSPNLPEHAGKLVIAVLVPYLPDKYEILGFFRTFIELWKLAAGQQDKAWGWRGHEYAANLRLLPGIRHPGRCLRWEVIDLGANWDKKKGIAPKDVRNSETSPHAGILSAAALHPSWVRAMNGKNVPFVWIPGYQVSFPGRDPWQDVPALLFYCDYRGIRLHCHRDDDQFYYWCVPSFCGE